MPLEYNEPVVQSHYTEKEYPPVTDADVYVSPDGDEGFPGKVEVKVSKADASPIHVLQ